MTSTLDKDDVSAPHSAPRATGHQNEAVRASLAALEAARRSQRRRRRRDRAVALLSTGLTVSAIWGFTTHVRSGSAASPAHAQGAPTVALAPAAPTTEKDLVEAPSVSAPPAQEPPASATTVSDQAAPTLPELTAACEQAGQRHNWRDVTVACAAVFAQQPDADRALAIAQAHFRRSQVAEAGTWADRALDLNPALPEAFILRAHAAEADGDEARAQAAYRQYLSLAPRGWHAGEAKNALARQN